MKSFIFLAAVEDELAFVKSLLITTPSIRKKIHCDFITLNIGVINSLIALEKHGKLLAKNNQVIFLGTAGMLGGNFIPGEIYQAAFFRWTSIGLALKKGYLPELFYPDIKAQRLLNGPQKIPVISTPEITSDDETAKTLRRQNGLCLENLEVYGIARWLKSKNIALSAFLSVTNQVGKEGHRQYLKYRKMAWMKLTEVVYHVLAPGKK